MRARDSSRAAEPSISSKTVRGPAIYSSLSDEASVLFGKNEWSPLGLQAFYISGQNGVIDLLDSKGPMVSLLSEYRADSKSHEIVRCRERKRFVKIIQSPKMK